MAPAACGVSPSSNDQRVPKMIPVQPPAGMMMQKDAIISWFRGEFAAANAIIDALCGHLTQLEEGGKCEYESVFTAIHRRRLNWIPILQMQKYFSIADVTLELQKVAHHDQHKIITKTTTSTKDGQVEEIMVSSVQEPAVNDKNESFEVECHEDNNAHVDAEVVDVDITRDDSPKSVISDSGLHEVRSLAENNAICSNQEEDWEARRAQIKMTKGFVAKESVKGHMVNVVRGLKLYDDILNDTELSKLSNYVNELRVAGQNGQLSGGFRDS